MPALALVLGLLQACVDNQPTVPAFADDAQFLIVDGAHSSGNPEFFFLPPLVPDPSGHPNFDPGAFDATLSPVVEICELVPAGEVCVGGPVLATFTTTSGSGAEVVRLGEPDAEHYIVNWHTDAFDLNPEVMYRITVLVEGTVLGYADVDVVGTGRDLKSVATGEFIGLVDGRTLPIKFRIEQGAVVDNDVTVDGAGRHFGPLPTVIYAFADDATGTDIYPLGDGATYLFGLFDTGSTKVRLYNEIPYYFQSYPDLDPNNGLWANVPNDVTDANWWGSDAELLGVTGTITARIRLNGLDAIDPTTLGAPIGLGAAQLEILGVQATPQADADDLPVTLLGAPVTEQAVVVIDYTQKVTRSGYNFYPGLTDPANSQIPGFQMINYVEGPSITFFEPGDPSVPSVNLHFDLERFGVPAVRWIIKGLEFRHNGAVATEDVSSSPPSLFLYDTGTTPTIIGDRVAGLLGLAAGTGSFNCLGGTNNGFTIDTIVITGTDGTYTVTNPSVCWSQDDLLVVLGAIIGSNLFDQVPVVFDGQGNTLGIGTPTSTPISW